MAKATALRQADFGPNAWQGQGGYAVNPSDLRDLDRYRDYVSAVADAKSAFANKVLVTRADENVSIVIAKILAHSVKRVCIVTRKLKLPVYGSAEVIDAATNFLERNPDTELFVLVHSDEDTKDHPLLIAMDDPKFKGRFQIDTVPDKLRTEARFVVGDATHYRFIERCDATEGFVKFGDPAGGKFLEEAFDKLWNGIQRKDEWARLKERTR